MRIAPAMPMQLAFAGRSSFEVSRGSARKTSSPPPPPPPPSDSDPSSNSGPGGLSWGAIVDAVGRFLANNVKEAIDQAVAELEKRLKENLAKLKELEKSIG